MATLNRRQQGLQHPWKRLHDLQMLCHATLISVLAMKLTAFLCFSAFNLHWVAGTKESGLGLHVGNGNNENENGNENLTSVEYMNFVTLNCVKLREVTLQWRNERRASYVRRWLCRVWAQLHMRGPWKWLLDAEKRWEEPQKFTRIQQSETKMFSLISFESYKHNIEKCIFFSESVWFSRFSAVSIFDVFDEIFLESFLWQAARRVLSTLLASQLESLLRQIMDAWRAAKADFFV